MCILQPEPPPVVIISLTATQPAELCFQFALPRRQSRRTGTPNETTPQPQEPLPNYRPPLRRTHYGALHSRSQYTVRPICRTQVSGGNPPPGQKAEPKVNTPDTVIKYGFLMSLISNNANVRNMGFGWVSYGIFWSDEEPVQGQYSWLSGANNVDNIADGARNANVNILIRISRTPAWARDPNCSGIDTCPPANAADFGRFAGALATRVRSHLNGQQVAYEIWNEPNTDFEWGGSVPGPCAIHRPSSRRLSPD